MITAAASTGPSSGGIIAVWVVIVLAYWVPTIIAAARRLPNVAQIALLNFFLGWTVIGWIVALIWAAKPRPAVA